MVSYLTPFLQVIDCCAQQRTYEKFFGLLAQRLCQLKREYIEPFQTIFVDSYNTCHRLEIGKLRNVTKLFAHLLFTDAIGWVVLSVIHLNEHETTSSSRIFIKMLFQVNIDIQKCSCCFLISNMAPKNPSTLECYKSFHYKVLFFNMISPF